MVLGANCYRAKPMRKRHGRAEGRGGLALIDGALRAEIE